MHKTVQRGMAMGLVRYQDTPKGICIEYIHQQKRCLIGKPEEWVRLLCYLHLVMLYDYPPEHIAIEYPIKMGSSYRYADIVVFDDANWQQVRMVVECKREDIEKAKFDEGVKQAISYARQLNPAYIWVSAGEERHAHRYFMFRQGNAIPIAQIPPFSIAKRWWREFKSIFGR
jgi:hypothetical protein